MKVLYVITLSDLGGAQVHLYEVISNLPKDITSYVVIGQEGWLSHELKKMNVTIYIVPQLVREISLRNDIHAILDIKKIIKAVHPDIIHCHSSKAGVVGRIVAKFTNVPVIFTAHGWAFTEGVSKTRRWVYSLVEKFMARWTQRIFCVSEYDRQLAIKIMPEHTNKLITIHNGISDIEFPKRAKMETLNVVMIARFSPQKDHVLLIDAIEELNSELGMNFRLTFVGNGPLYNRIYSYVMDKKCKSKIDFLGERTDVVNILAQHDVFVLTSNWEGFPISILEAMRQGLPIIASDVGGVREAVIDGETGFLIARANKNCLKEKLEIIYKQESLRIKMGQDARHMFLRLFSVEIMMRKIITIYDEVRKS